MVYYVPSKPSTAESKWLKIHGPFHGMMSGLDVLRQYLYETTKYRENNTASQQCNKKKSF